MIGIEGIAEVAALASTASVLQQDAN